MACNILLIHVDQHRADALGVNGYRAVPTPNLDRLAAGGVNFSQAFCPIAVCTPARTSLLTGLYPTQHGCLVNPGSEGYRPASERLPLFSQLLRRRGYWLGYVGKWSVGLEASPAACGFERYVAAANYRVWRQQQGLPAEPGGWFGEADRAATPAQSAPGWGADQVLQQLDAAVEEGRPFFIRWDPEEPQLPSRPP